VNKKLLLIILFSIIFLKVNSFALAASNFATRVLEYGPGADVGSYNNPCLALGAPAPNGTPGAPDNSSVVSLGGFGGYITLGFDHQIEDNPSNLGNRDFIIFGNSFYVNGNEYIHAQEPGYVEVAADSNGNGLADDTFYLIPGIPNPGIPAPFPISDNYWGVNGVDHRDYFTKGYADVTPTLGESYGSALVPDDPWTVGITPGSRGGDAFDIADAVNASGDPVNLSYVDFVRITTAIDASWPCGTAISAEVDAIANVAAVPEPATGITVLMGLPLLIRHSLWSKKKGRGHKN